MLIFFLLNQALCLVNKEYRLRFKTAVFAVGVAVTLLVHVCHNSTTFVETKV